MKAHAEDSPTKEQSQNEKVAHNETLQKEQMKIRLLDRSIEEMVKENDDLAELLFDCKWKNLTHLALFSFDPDYRQKGGL